MNSGASLFLLVHAVMANCRRAEGCWRAGERNNVRFVVQRLVPCLVGDPCIKFVLGLPSLGS